VAAWATQGRADLQERADIVDSRADGHSPAAAMPLQVVAAVSVVAIASAAVVATLVAEGAILAAEAEATDNSAVRSAMERAGCVASPLLFCW
jgi:hypothetical protein